MEDVLQPPGGDGADGAGGGELMPMSGVLSIDGHQYSCNPALKGAPSRARGAALHTIFSKKELRARVQEGPVRTVAPPSPPNRRHTRTAACPRFYSNASCVAPPFRIPPGCVFARVALAVQRGVFARPPPPQGAPHPRKARRIPPLPHLRPPRAIASNTPRPNAPSCPRARDFWPPNRVLARSAPIRRRIGFVDSPTWAFAGEERPFSGEGAHSACQNSVSWPEIACFPARRAGGVRRSRRGGRLRSPRGRAEEPRGARGGHAGGAAGRGGHAADARGGTEKPTSSPSRPKSLGDTSSLLRFRPHDCYTPVPSFPTRVSCSDDIMDASSGSSRT